MIKPDYMHILLKDICHFGLENIQNYRMAMDIFRYTSFMKLDKINFNKDKLNLCQVS